jgi:hypothetical protein
MCVPSWLIFYVLIRRAAQRGVVGKKEKSSRTVLKSVEHHCMEFDGTFFFPYLIKDVPTS